MKKIIYLLALSSLILISSCSRDDVYNEVNVNGSAVLEPVDDIVILSEDGSEPDSIIQKRVAANPEKYKFDDPHSELWEEEEGLRASTNNVALTAKGWDVKDLISTGKVMFPRSNSIEPRIVAGQYYISKTYQYKKKVQIPRGATLITPPDEIMRSYMPMGNVPGTKIIGYIKQYVSSNGTMDTYYLVTELSEITHDISGRQVAPESNPIYTFYVFKSPVNYIFKYQYSQVIW